MNVYAQVRYRFLFAHNPYSEGFKIQGLGLRDMSREAFDPEAYQLLSICHVG